MSASQLPATAGDSPVNRRTWSFWHRHGLLLVGISAVVANLIGSVFNILYNQYQIWPILSASQRVRFDQCWQLFNVVVYPIAVSCWVYPLVRMRRVHRGLLDGVPIDPDELAIAQRKVVNLPWRILVVAGISWVSCVPIFPAALAAVPGDLSPDVVWHLMVSFVIAGLIAVTHSFFAVELVSQRTLFPVFFQQTDPADVQGAIPLNVVAHGIMWALSAGVSPIVSLELLLLVPRASQQTPWYGVAVGTVGILFGLTTAWMLGKLIEEPVRQLKLASARVAEGQLDVRVDLLRADDFGPLIKHFNAMVEGLQERERLHETFGRHVGQQAARQILARDAGLGGTELEITVMFVDVRNFTEHASRHSPEEVVAALNIFFRGAVETIEGHGGMVNKFLGDGFMALFGIGSAQEDHAPRAVEAARKLLCCLGDAASKLEQVGWPGLKIGIGINTGPAIVGSIGSPKRQEYTAIGDTVNVAARVEALTKTVGYQLLVTESTKALLAPDVYVRPLPPQEVKGKGKPLQVFAICES